MRYTVSGRTESLNACRNLRALKHWRAHVHRCVADLSILTACPDNREHSTLGFDKQRIRGRKSAINRELRHAADTVPTHAAFASIGIEHAHANGRAECARFDRWWRDKDQAIATDSELTVSNELRDQRGIRHRVLKRVDIDVVIADAMHLHKGKSVGASHT